MNANPSGSRTPPAGGRGRSQARRELEAAAEPSSCPARVAVPAGIAGGPDRRVQGLTGGTRHAMKVCRGALNLRRTAQGRVGDHRLPRHFAHHLVPHPLLSANTSAPADAVRPFVPDGARDAPVEGATVRTLASRTVARPRNRFSPHHGARDTELVQPGRDVVSTSACGHSRGKGVLAA